MERERLKILKEEGVISRGRFLRGWRKMGFIVLDKGFFFDCKRVGRLDLVLGMFLIVNNRKFSY